MREKMAAARRRVDDVLNLEGLLFGVGDFLPLSWDPLIGDLMDEWLTRKKQVGVPPEIDRQIVWLLADILIWQARVAHLWRGELKAELLYREVRWGASQSSHPFSSRVNEEQRRRNAQHIADLAVSTYRVNANTFWVALTGIYDFEKFWPESTQQAREWVALHLPGPIVASLYQLCDGDEERARVAAKTVAPQLFRLCPFTDRWQAAWAKASRFGLEASPESLRDLQIDERKKLGGDRSTQYGLS